MVSSPAQPVLQRPQTASCCWRWLTSAALAPEWLRRTCVVSGHRSDARPHSLLDSVSLLLRCRGFTAVLVTGGTCSLVDTAASRLTCGHITPQLVAAEHEVAWLATVVARALPSATTSATTSTTATSKSATWSVGRVPVALGLSQLHRDGTRVPRGHAAWCLTHSATKALSTQRSSSKVNRLLH